MSDPHLPKSARRARWLAELAEAVGEAERLTALVAKLSPDAAEAVALRTRLRAVMAEIDALRRGLGSSADVAPLRTKKPRIPAHRGPKRDV